MGGWEGSDGGGRRRSRGLGGCPGWGGLAGGWVTGGWLGDGKGVAGSGACCGAFWFVSLLGACGVLVLVRLGICDDGCSANLSDTAFKTASVADFSFRHNSARSDGPNGGSTLGFGGVSDQSLLPFDEFHRDGTSFRFSGMFAMATCCAIGSSLKPVRSHNLRSGMM